MSQEQIRIYWVPAATHFCEMCRSDPCVPRKMSKGKICTPARRSSCPPSLWRSGGLAGLLARLSRMKTRLLCFFKSFWNLRPLLYVEAANFAKRFCPYSQTFYQRKMAKRGGIVAIKALSNKLARASYYVMKDKVAYDVDKLFRK